MEYSFIVPYKDIVDAEDWCHKHVPYMNWGVRYAGGVMSTARYCFEFVNKEDQIQFVLRFG
jgi:hypothetical protein